MNEFEVNVADLRRSRAADRNIAIGARVEWELEMSQVEPSPQGDNLQLELTLAPVGGGLLVHGTADLIAGHTCHRCLNKWTETVTVPISAMFSARSGEDDGTFRLEDVIDLEPAVRDDILTAMPMLPTCPDGCQTQLVGDEENGLNMSAPAEQNSADGAQEPPDMDEGSPFSALKDLLEPGD